MERGALVQGAGEKWNRNTSYSYFLILFFLTLENKNLAIQRRQQPTYEIQPLKIVLFFCGFSNVAPTEASMDDLSHSHPSLK